MPKIPRISLEGTSAGVPSAAPLSPNAVAAPLADLTSLADTAFDISSKEGQRQALEMRDAIEAKQAIVNEVEAGRRSGDYEEDITSNAENIKKELWDSPDKAPARLLELGRSLQDQGREAAPNTQVGLAFVQRSNARLAQAVREMHDWALGRQSQKAKGDLSVIVNRATAGAEKVGGVPALGAYIAAKEAELSRVFENVLGSGAQAAMAGMRAGMVRAWAQATGNRGSAGALSVLRALDSTEAGNPLVDNLKDTEREALRKDAKADFAGGFKNSLLEEVKKGTSQNDELFDLTMKAPQEAGEALYAAETALEEQGKAAAVQLKVDTAVLEEYGIDLQGRSADEIPKLIADRLRYVKALNYSRRTMIGFDAEDDPTTVGGLLLAADKEIKSNKDLAEYPKQQANLAVAFSDKKISQATFSTLYKTMANSLKVAAQEQEDPWGPNVIRRYFNPQLAAQSALTDGFATRPKFRDNKALQYRVRIKFLGQFLSAQERGAELTTNAAREMATRVLLLEAGESTQGVE
jgi:hypothetical protein